jgi:hypothetical protein
MAIFIALLVGMVIWIVGFALVPSPHANFDWFLPLPVLVLLAYIYERAQNYFRDPPP